MRKILFGVILGLMLCGPARAEQAQNSVPKEATLPLAGNPQKISQESWKEPEITEAEYTDPKNLQAYQNYFTTVSGIKLPYREWLKERKTRASKTPTPPPKKDSKEKTALPKMIYL